MILVDSLTVDVSEYNQFYKTMTTGDEINDDLPTIAEDLVVTKYKMAAEIVNSKLLLETCDQDLDSLLFYCQRF